MTFLSRKAQTIAPYIPGEQPKDRKYIKINTNENPYPPSTKVLEAVRQAANEDLRRYPDPASQQLKEVIAIQERLTPEQVFCSNGSDEVLAFCFPAFFNPEGPVLFPDITYSFYPVYAELFDIAYQLCPLGENLQLNPQDYQKTNGGIILANPNAPTGIGLALDQVERLVRYNFEQKQGIVIVDEAYIAFGGQTAVPLIAKYPNLLVVRTLSKSHSLAGLRVGYALGQVGLIEGLERIKNSFNSYPLDRLAQAGAIAAIQDSAYYEKINQCLQKTRERVAQSLKNLGFTVPDSQANFLFITHPEIQASALFHYLKQQGVLVRYFPKPKIDQYLRVSMGTDSEMDIFLDWVEQYLNH